MIRYQMLLNVVFSFTKTKSYDQHNFAAIAEKILSHRCREVTFAKILPLFSRPKGILFCKRLP